MEEFKRNLITEMEKLGVEDAEGVLASRSSMPVMKQSPINPIYHHLDESDRASACTINPWKEGTR